MFEITTEASFSAAHKLKNYKGPCENFHGHNWLVRASVTCDTLNECGIGIDFKELKQKLQEILKEFDHRDLNEIFDPLQINPSSELIAQYIFRKLSKSLNSSTIKVSRIVVYETPGNCAAYFE